MADLFDIISARLAADTGSGGVNEPVEGAIGGFHRGRSPERTPFARVHVQSLTGLPVHTMTTEFARRMYVQFMVYAKDPEQLPGESTEAGGKKAYRLNRRIQSLFFDADIATNDPSFIGSRLDRELPSGTEVDAAGGKDIFSEGCVLEMWTA